jgi:hypothetical protein
MSSKSVGLIAEMLFHFANVDVVPVAAGVEHSWAEALSDGEYQLRFVERREIERNVVHSEAVPPQMRGEGLLLQLVEVFRDLLLRARGNQIHELFRADQKEFVLVESPNIEAQIYKIN